METLGRVFFVHARHNECHCEMRSKGNNFMQIVNRLKARRSAIIV